jgi:tRNA(Arg) A34 adenosine deaminase TadA
VSAGADGRRLWAGLDKPWQEAFGQAWEALRSGNIAVGACAATPDGEIVRSARNRVFDGDGPPGEIFGSALAHAETNVLARLPFRSRPDLVLTTTLEPCLQCAAAIRLGPVGTVRFAGPDRYWDGCADFGKLSTREARRSQPARIGPRCDELGTFATLISRFGPTLTPGFEKALRTLGEGPMVDLVYELEADGVTERLAAMEVHEALGYLWPRLQELKEQSPAS